MEPVAQTNLRQDINDLSAKLSAANLPPDLKSKVSSMLSRLTRLSGSVTFLEEYDRITHYLNWVSQLPWNKFSPDNYDLIHARQILDNHHYGLIDVKERLLEYLAVLKLNHDQGKTDHVSRAPILLLVGLVGTGKTTFAAAIAEAMGRQLIRIPFGGLGSGKDLRGESRLHLEAEPGLIIKALIRAKTSNPVILLDEIDRIAVEARTDIMGVLVELLDPEQNQAFTDYYVDYPFDLSQVIFIGTANATANIATAVMDRMEPIGMPSYTDEEKIAIGKGYLLPKSFHAAGLPNGVLFIEDALWPQIVRPLGYDSGIRTLRRTIDGIVRKVARELVEGKIQTLHLTPDNIDQYLPSFKTELI